MTNQTDEALRIRYEAIQAKAEAKRLLWLNRRREDELRKEAKAKALREEVK